MQRLHARHAACSLSWVCGFTRAWAEVSQLTVSQPEALCLWAQWPGVPEPQGQAAPLRERPAAAPRLRPLRLVLLEQM